jgi:hypothetical protein
MVVPYHGRIILQDRYDWATAGAGNHEIAIADGPHDPDSKKSNRPYPVNQTPGSCSFIGSRNSPLFYTLKM